MAVAAENAVPERSGSELQKIADLFGGARILSRRLTSALDQLVGQLVFIRKADSLEKAVGISLRTGQRRKAHPS